MKTIAITGNSININNKIAFKGHQTYLSDNGFKRHTFFMPYDSNKYNAKVEIKGFNEINGEWEEATKSSEVNLPPQGITIADNELFKKSQAVGYRFIFTDKNNPHQKIYKIDSGTVTNPSSSNAKDNFSILINNRTILPENKLTKQVMPDLIPGYDMMQQEYGMYDIRFNKTTRKNALNTIRNHGNKLGGNFAGIIKMLPHWSYEGYTKVVGTPFTKDEVSSHLYWTENPYQIATSLGTLDDFRTMQVEFFKNGMNFIADGAFVNQGLQGIMMHSILRHGAKSPYIHWFKAPGLLSGDLKLGAIPKNEKARENLRFRFVNMPIKIVEKEIDVKNRNGVVEKKSFVEIVKNRKYNPKRVSYIQIYDKRLVPQHELTKDNRLIKKYTVQNTSHPYEITSHEDVTQLLTFEVNSEKYTDYVISEYKKFKEHQKQFSNNDFIENLLKFPNFRLTTKDKGGIDLWDGNMDIAKLNFYVGNTDQAYIDSIPNIAERNAHCQKMNKSIAQVQDFTLKAGKYWTKVVADAQMEHVLSLFKDVKPDVESYWKKIEREVRTGNLPKKTLEVINKDIIANILNGNYQQAYPKNELISPNQFVERIRQEVMDPVLASYEFSTDLCSVLASPYITRYAEHETEFNTKRYDEFADELNESIISDKGEYEKVYKRMSDYLFTQLAAFVSTVMHEMNRIRWYEDQNDVLTHNHITYDLTELGHYIIPLLAPDIAKYVVVKSLNPKEEVKIDPQTGRFVYNPKSLAKISLKSLGIQPSGPENEALAVVKCLEKGTSKLFANGEHKKLAKALLKRFENLPVEKFKMAEAIIDRTGAGMGWRIDAAKDIGNIDALRTGNDNDERLLNQLIKFWGRFNDTVKSVNKNAYTTAEITNFDEVVKTHNGEYKNDVNAEEKFIERSGLNNTANYMFFFSLLRDMFAYDAESGAYPSVFNKIENLHGKLIDGWRPRCQGFLYQYPEDSISNSYTFVGNHDKPRVLHILALDMNLFHSKFTNADHIKRAVNVLGNGDENFKLDVYKLSSKAVAMGERILEALSACGLEDNNLKKAVSQLASGNYKGHKFNPDAFGVRDFKFVIKDVFDVAISLGYKPENQKEEMDAVLKNILTPAMDKMESVYKMLVTLPGSPTDFVGDKEGCSGYETKCNNEFQQNRNTVPFEWVNEELGVPEFAGDEKEFVANYYSKMTKIGALRNIKELSALRQGDTITLPLQKGVAKNHKTNEKLYDTNVAVTYRYDETGSQVICLYTTAGAEGTIDNKSMMNRPRVDLDKIILNSDNDDNYDGYKPEDEKNPNWKFGLKGGLNIGDTFVNVNDPEAEYEVQMENGQYILKNKKPGLHVSILPEDKNTAVLYKKQPNNETKQRPIPATFVLSRLKK